MDECDDPREYPAREFERDWAAYRRDIHAHLTADEELAVPLWQTRRMIAIIDATLRSAASGHLVTAS